MCEASHAQALVKLQPIVAEHFNLVGGVLLSGFVVLLVLAKVGILYCHEHPSLPPNLCLLPPCLQKFELSC